MTNPLVLPDGVRLPRRREIPGPREEKDQIWARVEEASFHPGFVVRASESPEFAFFFEVNVDANRLWDVFVGVVTALMGAEASGPCQLLFGDAEEELQVAASAELGQLLDALESMEYQLAHDGFLHFGIVRQSDSRVLGVLVTPTKHLQVWAPSRDSVEGTLGAHGLEEFESLDFLATYPVMCETPEDPPCEIHGAAELSAALAEHLAST